MQAEGSVSSGSHSVVGDPMSPNPGILGESVSSSVYSTMASDSEIGPTPE